MSTALSVTKPALQFEVPGAPTKAPPLDVPPITEQPIASGLATVDAETPESRSGIVCGQMIPPDQLQKAQAEAVQLVEKMLASTAVLMNYGLDALSGVNSLIDRLLRELPANDAGIIKDAMRELTLGMKSIKGKYDVSTPEGKSSYEAWEKGWLKKLVRRGRNYIQAMMADMQSVDAQLKKIEKDLSGRKMQMLRSITYLDQLYAENEVAIYNLIYVIAVMECVAEEARRRVEFLPEDSNGENKNAEMKQRLADLILQLDIKIGEYKGRLFVAWATSPQVRMMRVMNVGMAEKVNEAVGVTIPTMKLAIVQWRIMAETVDAGRATEAISDTTNLMMREVAAGMANEASDVMRVMQRPMLLPETVTAVTDSLVLMAENIIREAEEGSRKRAELDATMARSKLVLDGSSAHYDEVIVNGIVGGSRQQMLELTAGSSQGN